MDSSFINGFVVCTIIEFIAGAVIFYKRDTFFPLMNRYVSKNPGLESRHGEVYSDDGEEYGSYGHDDDFSYDEDETDYNA